ncbi:MAG: PKD domain-containing protein, partial [Anaerolineales bacterium]
YGDLGLAAYTFELGNYFFQNCSNFKNKIVPNNLPVLLYAAKVSRYPYLIPAGPDVLNLIITPSLVSQGEYVNLTASVNDTRYHDTIGSEPTQDIIAAEFYIDVPPWIKTSTPISHPMTAVDDSFDSPIEDVHATINTTELNLGQHTIYIRGSDGAGNWGPFSAVFLTVEAADPTAAFASNSPVFLHEAVHFDNQSFGTPPLSFHWDFGDNLGSSQEFNPRYSYSTTGTFTVTLVVTNTLSRARINHPVHIQPCIQIDSITLTQITTGTTHMDMPVQFDIDINPDDASEPYSYTINFDDGTPPFTTSTEHDPLPLTHNFVTTGTHNVSIAIWNCDQTTPFFDSIEIEIAERHGMTLLPGASLRISPPGTTVTHTLQLTNIGDTSDTFTLSLTGNNWDTSKPSTVIGPISPRSGTDLNFSVQIPTNAIGTHDVATLTLVSEKDPTQELTTNLTTLARWSMYMPIGFQP